MTGADNSVSESGAAYVFTRSGATWSQQAYLKASNTEAYDYFGISVAVSGDTVVVGAYQEDSNATGVGGDGADNSASEAGAAYVFGSGAAGPSLTLSKAVSPAAAKPGEAITYTISFSNTGAVTATSVIITDTLAAQIVNAGYTSSGVALTPVNGQTYAWTAPDLLQGEGGVITITGVLTKPLAAGTVPNTVTLAVSGTLQTASANLTVQNVAPAADAGSDQGAGLGETVTLNGSGTDDNGDTLTYGWTQTGGAAVTLSSASAQAPTFTAPSAAGALTFTLTVTDTGSLTGADEVVVTVSAGAPGYASAPAADSAINMGSVKVGASVTSTLVISETGNATLNITSLVLSGPNAGDFNVSPTAFSIVDGGAAQTVDVTCTPAGYGLRTATLTVNHNAAGSPGVYTLNCTGLIIYYFPIVAKNAVLQ